MLKYIFVALALVFATPAVAEDRDVAIDTMASFLLFDGVCRWQHDQPDLFFPEIAAPPIGVGHFDARRPIARALGLDPIDAATRSIVISRARALRSQKDLEELTVFCRAFRYSPIVQKALSEQLQYVEEEREKLQKELEEARREQREAPAATAQNAANDRQIGAAIRKARECAIARIETLTKNRGDVRPEYVFMSCVGYWMEVAKLITRGVDLRPTLKAIESEEIPNSVLAHEAIVALGTNLGESREKRERYFSYVGNYMSLPRAAQSDGPAVSQESLPAMFRNADWVIHTYAALKVYHQQCAPIDGLINGYMSVSGTYIDKARLDEAMTVERKGFERLEKTTWCGVVGQMLPELRDWVAPGVQVPTEPLTATTLLAGPQLATQTYVALQIYHRECGRIQPLIDKFTSVAGKSVDRARIRDAEAREYEAINAQGKISWCNLSAEANDKLADLLDGGKGEAKGKWVRNAIGQQVYINAEMQRNSEEQKRKMGPPQQLRIPLGPFKELYEARRKELEKTTKSIQTLDAATPICDMVLDDGIPARRKCYFPHARRASSQLCKSHLVSWAVQAGNKLRWVAGTSGRGRADAVETKPIWFREKDGKRFIGEPNNVLSYAHLVVNDDVQAQTSSGWHRLVYACLVDPVREELLDFAVTPWTPGDEPARALRRMLNIADTPDPQPLRSPDEFLGENKGRTLDPTSERERLIIMMAGIRSFDKYCRAFGRMSDEDIATLEKVGRDGGLTEADQPRIDEYAKMLVTKSNLRLSEFCRQTPRVAR